VSPSRVDPKGRFPEGRVDFLKEIDLSAINKKLYVYPAKRKKGAALTGVNFLSTLLPETRESTFGFFRKNLHKTNFINEIKEFSISPTLLLNNRLLLKINNTREGSNLKLKTVRAQASSEEKSLRANSRPSWVDPKGRVSSARIAERAIDFSSSKKKLFPNEEVLRKRKSIQKKRRITKLKKETRRRKKRMRFYPRPIWLRYRFYSQFLKNRRNMKKLNIDSSLNKISFNHLNNAEQRKNYEGKKISLVNFLNSYRDDNFEVSKFSGKKPKNLFGKKSYQHFQYSTGASNVNISPSVIGEFKTAFWKSYWLRSNLKPYFNKIKTSLKDIKETPKYSTSIEPSLKQRMNKNSENFYSSDVLSLTKRCYLLKNVKNFLFSFLGLNNLDNVNSTGNRPEGSIS